MTDGALKGPTSTTPVVLNATSATFEGSTVSTPTQGWAVQDKLVDALNNTNLGFVLTMANHVFVTTNTLGIQRGVNLADLVTGLGLSTVNVNAGTYNEDVTITSTLNLVGVKAGVDARSRATANEAIINSGLTAFRG